MVKNLKLTVAYEGTSYYGWQETGQNLSIEGSLKKVLETILQESIQLEAASRTDRGVHAEGQVVHFHTENERISIDKVLISANRLLPKDIVILKIEEVPLHFHSTLDSIGKEYRYYLCNRPFQNPKERNFCWHYPRPLNLQEMQRGAKLLIGTHDFSAFCNSRKNLRYADAIREILYFDILSLPGNQLCFVIRGKNFLYKMVRNLVGTLVYLGEGKLIIKNLEDLLANGKRIEGGVTAPAHGLSLMQIFYSESDYLHK